MSDTATARVTFLHSDGVKQAVFGKVRIGLSFVRVILGDGAGIAIPVHRILLVEFGVEAPPPVAQHVPWSGKLYGGN